MDRITAITTTRATGLKMHFKELREFLGNGIDQGVCIEYNICYKSGGIYYEKFKCKNDDRTASIMAEVHGRAMRAKNLLRLNRP